MRVQGGGSYARQTRGRIFAATDVSGLYVGGGGARRREGRTRSFLFERRIFGHVDGKLTRVLIFAARAVLLILPSPLSPALAQIWHQNRNVKCGEHVINVTSSFMGVWTRKAMRLPAPLTGWRNVAYGRCKGGWLCVCGGWGGKA